MWNKRAAILWFCKRVQKVITLHGWVATTTFTSLTFSSAFLSFLGSDENGDMGFNIRAFMILTVFPAFTSLTSHLYSLVFLDRMNVSTMCALREDMMKAPADKRKVSRASVGGYKGDYQGDYQGSYHRGLHHLHHQVSVGDHQGLHQHKTLNRNGWTWMKLEPE